MDEWKDKQTFGHVVAEHSLPFWQTPGDFANAVRDPHLSGNAQDLDKWQKDLSALSIGQRQDIRALVDFVGKQNFDCNRALQT